MPPVISLIIVLVSVIPFMLINAPTKKLVFRGFALTHFTRKWSGVSKKNTRCAPGAAVIEAI